MPPPLALPPCVGFVSRDVPIRDRGVTRCHFYVVGTSHVDAASARVVRDVVRAVRPSCVVLELDERRADALARDALRGVANVRYGEDLLAGWCARARDGWAR